MRFSPAPLPCPDCCVVCFCSVECRDQAQKTYHKYECKMKLYEMLHFMGDEFIDVFMAIRTVTMHEVQYFMDRKKELWKLLDVTYPEIIGNGQSIVRVDFKILRNLDFIELLVVIKRSIKSRLSIKSRSFIYCCFRGHSIKPRLSIKSRFHCITSILYI